MEDFYINGAVITEEDFQRLFTMLKEAFESAAIGIEELVVVESINGVNSLPAYRDTGSTKEVVTVPIALLKGSNGKSVRIFANDTKIYYTYDDEVETHDIIQLSKLMGDTPEFREKPDGTGKDWKYKKDDATTWQTLFTYQQLFDFDSLTAGQIALLKLKYSDLTEADKNDIKLPATQAKEEWDNTYKPQITTAILNAQSVSDHPGYIGLDYHVYRWDYTVEQYVQTERVLRPEGFSIYRVYTSIVSMNADKDNVPEGKFVLINTGSVEDADTAKLYVKGATDFEYLVDISGAIGFTGKTPQFSIGTITTGAPGSPAAVSISSDGQDEDGNPKYKLNITIPTGQTGPMPVFEVGTVTTLAPGSLVTFNIVPNGQTAEGINKYLVNVGIPQGATGSVENIDSIAITFAQASTRTNLASGDTIATLFGKAMKWFADLGSLAFKSTIAWATDITGIPSWIGPTKPTYTASEVGALPTSHNTDSAAHSDIRSEVAAVRLVAEGALVGYAFDTVSDMNAWIAVAANKAKLKIGNSLFIREIDVPDYWWDGTQALVQETQKVDLTGYLLSSVASSTYVAKEEGKSLITDAERTKLAGITKVDATATIAQAGWTLISGLYQATISNASITANSIVDAATADDSYDVAADAQILPSISTSAGSFVIKAKNQPSESIIINYTITNI